MLITAFLFATGTSIVFPVLPFIVAKYVPQVSQQAAMIGLLGAAYAFLSFFSSLVLGAMSDAYGRRPILILLGSATGYIIFGIGGSLWVLFVGRIIEGLCTGGMGALFGYVADSPPTKVKVPPPALRCSVGRRQAGQPYGAYSCSWFHCRKPTYTSC